MIIDTGTAVIISSTIAALVSLWTNRKVNKLGHEMNHIKDELVEATREAAHLGGKEEGRQEELARTKDV